jgi:hypothetical protein
MEIARQRIRVELGERRSIGVEYWSTGVLEGKDQYSITPLPAVSDFPEMPNRFPDLVKTPALLKS